MTSETFAIRLDDLRAKIHCFFEDYGVDDSHDRWLLVSAVTDELLDSDLEASGINAPR